MDLTYSHSSIAHLEQFLRDGEFSWAVNSCGHFFMMIMNVANAGGAGAKPLLGSVNTALFCVRVRLGWFRLG